MCADEGESRSTCRRRLRGAAPMAGVLLLAAVLSGCGSAPADYDVPRRYTTADPQFIYSIGNIFGQSFVGENRITTLVNGGEIFPAMIEGIQSAQKTITFETYIFHEGEASTKLIDALIERAEAGVRVHAMIDAVGGGASDRQRLAKLVAAGGQVQFYHPLRWWQLGSATKLNYRTHRKLLIIDGKVGFIGGTGIADMWLHEGETAGKWRDNHYRVEGPVVGRLQGAFMENWVEMTGQVLHGEEYFPKIEPAGDLVAQVINSSTGNLDQSVQVLFLMSLAAARQRVCISTPYFVLDEPTRQELLNARVRDVQVQVIVPRGQEIDSGLAYQASRAGWGDLLKAGVEIYEYQPAMYHTKLMVIDDLWVSLGSSNLDNRSFKLNDETNLNVLDADFAAQQMQLFEQDLRESRRVELDEWQDRPWWKKLLDGSSTLLESQL